MRRGWRAVALLGIAATILGWWAGPPGWGQEKARSHPPMRVARYYWPGQYWIEIADSKGWFKEAGLEVQLIVDDNPVNRRVVHEQLLSWGLRNGIAASGEEALRLLHEAAAGGDPYQLAILDHQMPGMDGEALAQAIKGEAALRGTVLVLLTSLSQLAHGERLRQAGFAAWLVKPVRPSQLMDVLASAWGRPWA